jgi:carboxylesterase type B
MSSHLQFISLLLFAVFSVLTVVVTGQHFEKSKSVWIEQGLVRGRIYKLGDKRMQMFRGIPYAEPPIGELRFRVNGRFASVVV